MLIAISKKVFIISLVLMGFSMGLSAYTIPGIPGTGTVNDPYLINNQNLLPNLSTPLSKLNKIANWVNKTGDWDGVWQSTGKHFRLMQDIDGPFTNTIGTFTSSFGGTFEGNGYRINVNISKPNERMVGLFGHAWGAVMRNLTVTGSVRGKSEVAGFVGEGGNVTLIHCTNLAKIEARDINNVWGASVAGIAGKMWGGVTIQDCANSGDIRGSYNIGGILADGHGQSVVIRSINIGTVRGEHKWVGGIAGRNPGNAQNIPWIFLYKWWQSYVGHCIWVGFG